MEAPFSFARTDCNALEALKKWAVDIAIAWDLSGGNRHDTLYFLGARH